MLEIYEHENVFFVAVCNHETFFNEEIVVVSALLFAWVCCHHCCTPQLYNG